MVPKIRQISPDFPKGEVGEIDTSSPFSSVKDAVSLFGEVALSGDKTPMRKSRAQSAEVAFVRETQFHLADKEMNKLKIQLKNAETTKAEALIELEKAKQTFEDLTLRLKAVCKSKDSALKATEAANDKLKQLEEANRGNPINGEREMDMESARELHTVATMELNDTKQELTKIRQDFDAAMESKVAALKNAEEAECAAKTNMEKASDLSKEISAIKESIGIVKVASLQVKQEQAEIFAEKDVQKEKHMAALEASTKKLLDLKNESGTEVTKRLEAQLGETVSEIDSLRKQLENVKASDLDSLRTVTSELDDAKESLQKVAKEESSLQSFVDTLKAEVENVKKELSESMKKEYETEFITGDLNTKLQRSKSELKACSEEEAKTRGASDDLALSLHQLSLETENAKRESEEMLEKAEELKKEAESTRVFLEEHENKLRVALEEAEEAKTAEAKAVDQVKGLSENTSTARASTSESESGAIITISKEEYESLTRKVAESDALAEMKVSAALAEAETVKASENEALKKLEANGKEMEEMKTATECALRKADMAEAARMAVEGELRRWREIEQKKAAELAKSPSHSSPNHYSVQKQRCPEKTEPTRKLEKAKTTVPKKPLMRNISSMFHKKKNLSNGGTPSYLPEYNTMQTTSYLPEHTTI